MFVKATKSQAKLRMAFIGPSGSGKTYSALKIASALGSKIALIDTERGSASKYADKFSFDTVQLVNFSPENYIAAIRDAIVGKYDVLIIDSLSHAWSGVGGILEFVDEEKAKSKSGNAFTEGWRKATPLHNKMVDAIVQSDLHVIVTMRAKTEYVIEKNEKGYSIPRKVGLAPIQRDGLEYEFDIVGDMDGDNNFIVSKTRCEALQNKMFPKPDDKLASIIKAWLTDGTEPSPKLDKKVPEPEEPAKKEVLAVEITDETILKLVPEKKYVLEKKLVEAGYKINLANVEGGLVHKVNTEKNRLGELTIAEARLLANYANEVILAKKSGLTGKRLEEIKAVGEETIKRVQASGEKWEDAWKNTQMVKPEQPVEPSSPSAVDMV